MKAIVGLLLVFVLVCWGCSKDDPAPIDASQDAPAEVDLGEPEADSGTAEPDSGTTELDGGAEDAAEEG